MAERTSLTQIHQLGIESTPGTAVAATKRLQMISIEPSVAANIDKFRPTGQKFASMTAVGKEWVTAALSGRNSYTEIVYLLSSVLDAATITTPGTTAKLWTFTPDSLSEDAPKTYTIEHGSSVRADKFAYGIVSELGMTFNRNSCEISGSMLGQRLTDGITLTSAGSVSTVALQPILPTQVSVYIDTTSGGLGTTKLTRAFNAEVSIGNRYGMFWPLDAALTSFGGHIETEPDVTLTLQVEADSTGMGILSDMRAASTKFIRIEAVGATDSIESGHAYTFTLDMAAKVSEPNGFTDIDGVYGAEWTFTAVHDSTWGKALTIGVKNALAAL